jgi:TonB family protein
VAGPTIAATQRKVLPPLEVEVVAGGQRRTLQPKNNTIRVDLQDESAGPATPASSTTLESTERPTLDASTSVHMSAETEQMVSRPVEPSYPMLAKQMKVQGAVVLRALIGRSGNIEDLHVLSGPAILSSAAMEAVKQWRFKPYFQNERAVETEARITVNFTISTY